MLEEAFHTFDSDDGGYIERDEIHMILDLVKIRSVSSSSTLHLDFSALCTTVHSHKNPEPTSLQLCETLCFSPRSPGMA